MSFYVVIPARYASSRLPAKPLKDIVGKPMIQHVYQRACASNAQRVIVATDDERIAEVVRGFGGEVCITSAAHESGTDRLQEVAQKLALAGDVIVVNVQGDEPLIPPEVIDQVAGNLAGNPAAAVATLSEPIKTCGEFLDPGIVKVIKNSQSLALYFSRAPIPWPRDESARGDLSRSENPVPRGVEAHRHIGIYAYRVDLLNRYVGWSPAPLEKLEKLEQLRVLWHGESVHVATAVCEVPGGVDTEADLARVRRLLQVNANWAMPT